MKLYGLLVPKIGKIGGPIMGIYKLLTDTWIHAQFHFWECLFQILSVQCLCYSGETWWEIMGEAFLPHGHIVVDRVQPESIEWFIEDQSFLPSYDLAPPPPPLSRQQVVSLSQSSWCRQSSLLTGEWGFGCGGGAWSSINHSTLSVCSFLRHPYPHQKNIKWSFYSIVICHSISLCSSYSSKIIFFLVLMRPVLLLMFYTKINLLTISIFKRWKDSFFDLATIVLNVNHGIFLSVQPFNYSRPGGVWLVTSQLGTGKSITFFTVLAENSPGYVHCTSTARSG